MKQKRSSDVKGSLWNHLDKKVLLWHREAPLFLRVQLRKIIDTVTNKCLQSWCTHKLYDNQQMKQDPIARLRISKPINRCPSSKLKSNPINYVNHNPLKRVKGTGKHLLK